MAKVIFQVFKYQRCIATVQFIVLNNSINDVVVHDDDKVNLMHPMLKEVRGSCGSRGLNSSELMIHIYFSTIQKAAG